jgi:hypothetical protein
MRSAYTLQITVFFYDKARLSLSHQHNEMHYVIIT